MGMKRESRESDREKTGRKKGQERERKKNPRDKRERKKKQGQ